MSKVRTRPKTVADTIRHVSSWRFTLWERIKILIGRKVVMVIQIPVSAKQGSAAIIVDNDNSRGVCVVEPLWRKKALPAAEET